MKRIVYISKVSKTGEKLYIVVPRKFHKEIECGKTYRITLEGPLEEMDP